MQAPIPDDWLNDAWVCYAIQWPDSTKWLSILNGLLSNPRQGRFWNRQTGLITDAQIVGAEIWYRNNPLVACADSGECPSVVYVPCATCGTGGGGSGSDDLESDDMPCLDISNLIKIENGHLWVKDSCCVWVDLGAITEATSVEPLPDDPLVPPGEDVPTYYACGKADAAVEMVWAVGSKMWDTGTLENPWEWPNKLRANFPELHGGVSAWVDGCMLSFLFNGDLAKSDVLYDSLKELLKCRLAARMDDDDQGLTDDDFKYLFELIQDQWNWSGGLDDIQKLRWWIALGAVIGPGDLREISRLGATTDADCTCPDEVLGIRDYFPDPPAGLAWYYEFDFRDATLHSSIDLTWDTTAYHEPGVGLWADCGPTNNDNHVYATMEWDQQNNGSTLTYLHLVIKIPSLASNIWHGANGNFVKVGSTSHLALADFQAVAGNPANAGTYTLTRQMSDALGADNVRLEMDINGYHDVGQQLDDLPANSFVIVGVAIGGSGPGPLSTPPA